MKKIFYVFSFCIFLSHVAVNSSGGSEIDRNAAGFKTLDPVACSMRKGVPCYVYQGVAYPAIGTKEGARVMHILNTIQRSKKREEEKGKVMDREKRADVMDKAFRNHGPLHDRVETYLSTTKFFGHPEHVLQKIDQINTKRAVRGVKCSCCTCRTYKDLDKNHLDK